MYKEGTFEYDIWCKHQGHAVNQGLTWCNAGHPNCGEDCPFREPEHVKSTWSSASTED